MRPLRIIALGLILFSCDFSSRTHKQILRARELTKGQQYTQAIEQYKKILEKSPPDEMKIHYQIGELYSLYLFQNRQAIEAYKKTIETSKNPLWMVKAQEKIAEINFSFIKDFETASKNYEGLVGFVPKLPKHDFYQYRLALSYLNTTQKEKGRGVLKEIQQNPEHEYFVQSLYRIGMYHFLKKDWKEAINHWNRYIKYEKRKDSIVHTRFLMANAYETMEELKMAYNIYSSLLTSYPNIEVIKNRLESIYARRVARKR